MKNETYCFFLMLFVSLGLLSTCNTVEGVGKDIESAGDSIEDAVNDSN